MRKSKSKDRINNLIRSIKQKEIQLKQLNNQLNNQLMTQNSRTNQDILNNRQKMNNARPKLTFKKRRKMKKALNQSRKKY
jgi:hypothetical protein